MTLTTTTLALFYFDPMYFVYVGPAILLAMWAQFKVKSAYAHASQIPARSGLSGAQTAAEILRAHNIRDVQIESVQSFLGDHYDPRHKVLRLSPDVYHGRSLASLGIAAHEVGHAIQHAQGYAPLTVRNALVPVASIGSNISVLLVIIGLGIGLQKLALVGIGLFATVVAFQLINLPVEFNASSRARQILVSQRLISKEEDREVGRVLSAAAMTYVAATLTAILTLLYYLSKVSGSRRD